MTRTSKGPTAGRTGPLLGILLSSLALTLAPASSEAAENGTGFYLLGSKGPLAGILPPPGIYFQNDAYFYSGSISAEGNIPVAGKVVANVDATAYIDLLSGSWVLPSQVLGGRLAILGTLPWGGQQIDARLAAPAAGARADAYDNVFTIGDPILGAALGWDHGNFHWTAGFITNIPIGDYQEGEIANLAFHRWGLDVNGAMTWFDPNSGWDLSAALGVTFNGENPDTDYRTGTELHLEGAITKALTQSFSAGLIGYYYNQISDDGGSGSTLGAFRGRVAALGGTAAYNFQLGNTPVSTRVKVYREFAAHNRLEGTAGFLTVSFPLSTTSATPSQ